jgi:hypothetical protein
MSEMPNIRRNFRDYSRCIAIASEFVAATREDVAASIKANQFQAEMVEATCMSKVLCTGFGVDVVSVVRKMMGARALQSDSMLGPQSFLPNATSGKTLALFVSVCLCACVCATLCGDHNCSC